MKCSYKRWIGGTAFLTILLLGPARATTVVEEKFVCPVGGEKFKAMAIASYSSWGQRPDGRAYGTLPIYPIIECPKNGMLLIDEKFTDAELQVLNTVVPSAEFQAMRAAETPHYRAWWLKSKIGRDRYEQASMLLQATWETDKDFNRKVRYQAEFVALATGLPRDADHGDAWLFYNLRAANGLRELGYFDKALSLLDRVDKPQFMPKDSEDAEGARFLISALRTLATESNPVSEPANMIPEQAAALRCEQPTPPLSPSEISACDKPELAPVRKQAREWIADAKKDEAEKK